jgi:hypothetical protein
MQNKLQNFTMTVPRVRSRNKNNFNNFNITESREEIEDRRLPGDDLYLPSDVN